MNRKRVVTAFMIVTFLGALLSMVGTFVASGLNQGGSLQSILFTASMAFLMLFWVSLASYPNPLDARQNQSEAEQDSSLV